MKPIKRTLTLFTVLLLTPLAALHAADITITAFGQPKAVLVLAEGMKPSASAATTLLSHVRQMSGAELRERFTPRVAQRKIRMIPRDAGYPENPLPDPIHLKNQFPIGNAIECCR